MQDERSTWESTSVSGGEARNLWISCFSTNKYIRIWETEYVRKNETQLFLWQVGE